MRKMLSVLLVVGALIMCDGYSVEAHSVNATTGAISEIAEVLRGDSIITKYRFYNGHFQYRHWNETKQYWVEPDWIDAS